MSCVRTTALVVLTLLLAISAASAKEVTYGDICGDPASYYKKSVTFRITHLGTNPAALWHVEAVLPVSRYYHFRQTGSARMPIVLKRSDSASKTMKNLKEGMSITIVGTVKKKAFKHHTVYYVQISKIKAQKSEVEGVARDELDVKEYSKVAMKDVEDSPFSYENRRVRFTYSYAGKTRLSGAAGWGIGKESSYIRLATKRKGEFEVPVFILKSNKEASNAVKDDSIKKGRPVEVFGCVRVAVAAKKKYPHVIVECLDQTNAKSEDKDKEIPSKIKDKERKRRSWKALQRRRQ